MSGTDVINSIKENNVKFIDFRFTDTHGKEQHVSVPASTIDESTFEAGKMFDGSSIAGWKGINESDMILMPDPSSAVIDPFLQDTTLLVRCDIIEPTTMQGYDRDPRSVAKRAEAYLKSTGIADTAYFGPESEFFIFDDVRWDSSIGESYYHIDSSEASWNAGKSYEDGNIGHRPGVKGGYFPVPPVDSQQDVRSAMCLAMEEMGLPVEVHHHEVGTAGQGEIGVQFNTLVRKADESQLYKYCVHNVAHLHGMTATFMPKPLVGDNGNGMHVHQSLAKDGVNVSMVMNTAASQKQRSTISVVFSNMRAPLMLLQMPALIAISAWFPVLRPPCCLPTLHVTALLRVASHMKPTQRGAGLRSVFLTQQPTPIWPLSLC